MSEHNMVCRKRVGIDSPDRKVPRRPFRPVKSGRHRRRAWPLAAALALLLHYGYPADARADAAAAPLHASTAVSGRTASQSISLQVEVRPGRWTGTGLARLPTGARLAIEIEGGAAFQAGVFRATQYSDIPDPHDALFFGEAARRLAFELTVPEEGTYVLGLVGASATDPTTYRVRIRATHHLPWDKGTDPPRGQPPATTPPSPSAAAPDAQLARIAVNVSQIFARPPIAIDMAPCGAPSLIASPGHLRICAEYPQALVAALGDPSTARDALLFALLRALSDQILAPHPGGDRPTRGASERDGAAAMLARMFGREEAVTDLLDVLAETPEIDATLDLPGPRRARVLRAAMTRANGLREAEADLLAAMSDAVVAQLLREPPAWADPLLLGAERTRRDLP